MLGAYQDGILTVAEPTAVSIVPEHVREIVAALQECIRASPLPAHDRVRHIGVFRELLVRTTVTKETMAMLLVRPVLGYGERNTHRCSSLLLSYSTSTLR